MIDTLRDYEEALAKRPAEIAAAREKGGKVVGLFCCYTPVEIVHALGLIPVRLGWGGDDTLAEEGIEYITNIQCPYVRQTIGVFHEGKNPYALQTDLVAISAVCLQEYRMVEVLRYYFGKETLTLSVPKNFYLPEGREFFTHEVEAFAASLEKLAGKKLDQRQLVESVAIYDAIRKSTAELYNFLLLDNSPIKWGDIIRVIHAGFYLAPEIHLHLLRKLIAELKRIPIAPKVKPLSNVRIILAGSIIAPGNTKIIDLLESLGVTVVGDDICTGQRTFASLDVKEPTLAGLAEAYLERTPCAAQLYPDQKTDKRLENLFRLIDEHHADGVLYHTLRFCDPYTFRVEENKALLDARDIPFLQLHTDYGVNDIGQLQTRIQAQVEIIRRRKKEGTNVGSQAAV